MYIRLSSSWLECSSFQMWKLHLSVWLKLTVVVKSWWYFPSIRHSFSLDVSHLRKKISFCGFFLAFTTPSLVEKLTRTRNKMYMRCLTVTSNKNLRFSQLQCWNHKHILKKAWSKNNSFTSGNHFYLILLLIVSKVSAECKYDTGGK